MCCRDFDRDRSGQMDSDEYLAAMMRLRVGEGLARDLFEAADLPGGELDMEVRKKILIFHSRILISC